jgi:5'(3')-deoxyribonucleotidase
VRVAIDVDGVLSDVVGHILPILNTKYNTKYQYRDVNHWDFSINGISIGEHLKEYFFNQEFLLTTPEIEGAREALIEIAKRHEITIVTGRLEYTRRYTYLWLNDRFVYDKIIFTNKKTIQSTDCDLLIDDYFKYINDFSNSGGNTIQLLQPWNENYIAEEVNYVATKWEEIPGLIERF